MIIGAGAFFDSKLSLNCEVGGDLLSLIGTDKAQKTSATRTGLEFGADFHVEGLGDHRGGQDYAQADQPSGTEVGGLPVGDPQRGHGDGEPSIV